MPHQNPITQEAEDIISSRTNQNEKLLQICKLIQTNIEGCDWVGFYMVNGEQELVLGPYVGEPTDHTQITFGSGICGQAAERKETFVVDDVSQEKNYISCSIRVRSEIVIPIIHGDTVLAELDIDSHSPSAFNEEKKSILEELCNMLVPLFNGEKVEMTKKK